MSQGRYPFLLAYEAASLFCANVRHTTHRLAIAGSLRRHLSQYGAPHLVPSTVTVGDIELVACPRTARGGNALWSRLDQMGIQPWIGTTRDGKAYTRWGVRYRKAALPIPGIGSEFLPADIFLADSGTWGYILALRTGPGEANALWARPSERGGLKPPEISLRDGKVYHGAHEMVVLDERAFFRLLELPYLAPHERSAAAFLAARREVAA